MNGVLISIEYYDDVTDKWNLSVPMIEKKAGYSVVTVCHYIYIIGGYKIVVERRYKDLGIHT